MSQLSPVSPEPDYSNFLDAPVFRKVLPNGLTLIAREDPSHPLISVQAWIKTGSIHEGSLLGCGLSHYLEHLLFKGTAKRTAQELTREIHALGGYVNAYTTFDRTVAYIDGPSAQGESFVEILQDFVMKATLPREEVIREKDVILREIDMGLDDPDRQVLQGLFETAFRRHPYRYPVIGYKELFRGVQPEELETYYAERYVPDNTVLVVVGDFETEALLEWVESTWGELDRGRIRTPQVSLEPDQLAHRETRLAGEVKLHRGCMAWKAPGLTDADAPALDLLASVLGSGDSALLWQEIRDRQKAVFEIDASAWTPLDGGLFWIWYTAEPGKGNHAESAITDYLMSVLSRSFPGELVEKAKRQALVSEMNARKTVSGQAGRLGLAEVAAGDLDYPKQYFSRLQPLTGQDLMEAGRRVFREAGLTAVSLEPLESRKATFLKRGGHGEPLPPFERIQLDNGVRILLQPDARLPKLHLRAALLGGPLFEGKGQSGVSRLLATLLSRDTHTRTAAEVAETIESTGGSFKDFSGNNTFGLGVEVLRDQWEIGLEILQDGLLQPAFQAETLERERDAQVAEIEESFDEIVDFGCYHLRERFFGEHPFRRDSYGTIEEVRCLDREAVAAHHGELLKGNNLVVAAAGDYKKEALVEALSEAFGKVSAEGLAGRRAPFTEPAATGRQLVTLPRQQAVVFSAFPCPGLTDEGNLASELLDECLSGMASRLFQRVREEKGMAYFVSARRIVGIDCGMLTLYAGTHPDQVEAVYEEFSAEMERFRVGAFLEDELTHAKTRLKTQRISGMQAIGARALQAALNTLYGLPVNDWLDYPERIDAVSEEDLQELVRNWMREEQRLDLVVRAGD